MAKKNWIASAVGANPGGLHASTHTPADKKVPAKKVAAAAAGKFGPKAKKQAALARTLGKLRG